jgi:hypothetical protein
MFACWVYFFFAAFFATFLAAFFVAILPVLPVIKRVRCTTCIAANEGIDFVKKSVKRNRYVGTFFLGVALLMWNCCKLARGPW